MMCPCLRGFACIIAVVGCSLFTVGRWLLLVGSCCLLWCVVDRCLLFVAICCCVISLFVVVVACGLVSGGVRCLSFVVAWCCL